MMFVCHLWQTLWYSVVAWCIPSVFIQGISICKRSVQRNSRCNRVFFPLYLSVCPVLELEAQSKTWCKTSCCTDLGIAIHSWFLAPPRACLPPASWKIVTLVKNRARDASAGCPTNVPLQTGTVLCLKY